MTAIITVTFSNTNPGVSSVTATHSGEAKTLTQSGTITFNHVLAGDIIMMQGKSLGDSEFKIDISATPQDKKFPPGKINFNFIIL